MLDIIYPIRIVFVLYENHALFTGKIVIEGQ